MSGAILFFGFVGGAVVYVDIGGDDDGDVVSSEGPSVVSMKPSPRPETRVVAPVEVDGWQSVVHEAGVYAYDVPPDWVPKPNAMHGWETEDGTRLTLTTSAFVGEGYCADDADRQRGGSGLTVAEGPDAGTIAADTVRRLAEAVYASDGGAAPEITMKPPETVEITLRGGRKQASLVLADVAVRDDGDACLPDTALVGALAMETTPNKAVVFLVYDGQDGPDSGSEEELTRLLTSLRVPDKDKITTTVVTPTP